MGYWPCIDLIPILLSSYTNIFRLLFHRYGYILLMLLFTSTVTSIASRRDRPTSSTPYSSTFNYALPTLLSGLFWPKLALALAAAQFWGVVLTVALAPASSSPPSSANNPAAVLGKTQAPQQAGGGGHLLTVAKSIEAASLLGKSTFLSPNRCPQITSLFPFCAFCD